MFLPARVVRALYLVSFADANVAAGAGHGAAELLLLEGAALLVAAAGLVGAHGVAGALHTDVASVARVGRAGRLAALFLPARVVLACHRVSVADASVAAGAGDRVTVLHHFGVIAVIAAVLAVMAAAAVMAVIVAVIAVIAAVMAVMAVIAVIAVIAVSAAIICANIINPVGWKSFSTLLSLSERDEDNQRAGCYNRGGIVEVNPSLTGGAP